MSSYALSLPSCLADGDDDDDDDHAPHVGGIDVSH